jgi:hypothetical protein
MSTVKIYLLTILLCNGVSGECTILNKTPKAYDSYYKCMQDGYGLSYELIFAETPRETVEDYKLFTRWMCKEELTPET